MPTRWSERDELGEIPWNVFKSKRSQGIEGRNPSLSPLGQHDHRPGPTSSGSVEPVAIGSGGNRLRRQVGLCAQNLRFLEFLGGPAGRRLDEFVRAAGG
jgi:hypothetical protein